MLVVELLLKLDQLHRPRTPLLLAEVGGLPQLLLILTHAHVFLAVRVEDERHA